ncbi:MAG: hypothetical protein K0R73_348 [Candidatus Midichloriaceae bacterium]|jgi:hypothetical protein|nr:hypothetical protein [Candidatus Midichloriaceae bacterium]
MSENKSTPPKETKAEKLAKKLRANLVRRKQAASKDKIKIKGSGYENK